MKHLIAKTEIKFVRIRIIISPKMKRVEVAYEGCDEIEHITPAPGEWDNYFSVFVRELKGDKTEMDMGVVFKISRETLQIQEAAT